jgi:hypothetical protein
VLVSKEEYCVKYEHSLIQFLAIAAAVVLLVVDVKVTVIVEYEGTFERG